MADSHNVEYEMPRYRVERRAGDTSGCNHCGHDQQWTIVEGHGDDAIEDGTSWGGPEGKELAEEICERMNDAFEAGRQVGMEAAR